VEAAYVNYVKAISIVVEVIPQHKGMKELEEKRTVQAQEYWIFRNVQSTISMLSMRTATDTNFSAYPSSLKKSGDFKNKSVNAK
jgi:hypothetical protein